MTGVLYFFTHLLKGAKPDENWPSLGSSSVYFLVSMTVKTLVYSQKTPPNLQFELSLHGHYYHYNHFF